QGPLQSTGEPLDVALQGPGFLAVKTASGVLYTRDGQLDVDGKGTLITADGNPVLDRAGKTISIGTHATDLSISSDGTITAGKQTLGALAVVSLTNPGKVGANLFSGRPGPTPVGTTVRQGALEGS